MSRVSEAFITTSLKMSDSERSRLTGIEKNTHGLSSIRVKCLINNLASKVNTNYLEIGAYKGSTIIAALFDNPKTKATAVEHFLYDDREPDKWAPKGFIWDNMKSQFQSNLDKYKGHPDRLNRDNLTIIESSFQEVDWSKQPKFNLVFFDVAPVDVEVYDNFFEMVLPALTEEAVVVFSQQSSSIISEQLNDAFIKHQDKVEVVFKEYRISSNMSDSKKYYSGLMIAGIKKKKAATPAKTSTTKKA